MKIKKRMLEIKARIKEIRKLVEEDENANITELETEIRTLETEYEKLEQRLFALDDLNNGITLTGENPVAPEQRTAEPFDQEVEYRNAWLKTLLGRQLTENELRAYTTAAGSALPIIPEATANAIIKKMYEVAPILEKCKIFHVPGNFKFAVEDVNDPAALHTQNTAITVAGDKLGEVSLTGYEIVKLVKASRASSEMALSAFEAYIVEVVAESIARQIEKLIFTGTGSNQPGGVAQGGMGTNGAYTDDVDQVTIGATVNVTEANVTKMYGMLRSGYEREALWAMGKTTFFADFYPLMNLNKNNIITFANGKYYIMGAEVYFTGSLAAGTVYYGNFNYIIGNFSQDITIVKSEHSGLATNSIDYLGSSVYDSKAVPKLGAFVKMVKETTKAAAAA